MLEHFFSKIVKKIGFFPIKDMQTLPLSFDPVFMNDGECAV